MVVSKNAELGIPMATVPIISMYEYNWVSSSSYFIVKPDPINLSITRINFHDSRLVEDGFNNFEREKEFMCARSSTVHSPFSIH